MNKIQFTEEQAKEMLRGVVEKQYIDDYIKLWKDRGYIIKNPVEEAEEIISKVQDKECSGIGYSDANKLCEAIQYQAEEIKRLKNEDKKRS